MGARWQSRMVRHYTVAEILPLLIAGETKEIEGHRVAFGSPRLQTFQSSGDAPRVTCVNCGLKGAYFVLEQDFGGGWHLNLYAINGRGQEVMMTSDHIVPQSRGGAKNDPSNRQPMCETCNRKKDNRLELEAILDADHERALVENERRDVTWLRRRRAEAREVMPRLREAIVEGKVGVLFHADIHMDETAPVTVDEAGNVYVGLKLRVKPGDTPDNYAWNRPRNLRP